MCFAHPCVLEFRVRAITDWLSILSGVGSFCEKPSSASSIRVHNVYDAAFDLAMYLASMLDKDTDFCFLNDYMMVVPDIKMTYSDIDFQSSTLVPQSASE